VGRRDAWARLALGGVLVLFALFCPWAAKLGLGVQGPAALAGAALIATAAMRRCPLYRLLGTGTDRRAG
jgi:hypothetical protein